MSYGKDDVINVATKLGRLVNGGVVGYYAGGKTSEVMSKALPDQLISVVEKHKKIQLGASLAQSFIPGAGVAATAAAVGSLWKMYYDINQVLGIKVSENAGKSLTSAVLTNFGSFAAKGAATAVSEGAKFIPFVGWIASAGISTVTTTAIIYGSAYVYMNALSAMYSAKGKFDLDYLTSEISCGTNNTQRVSPIEAKVKEIIVEKLGVDETDVVAEASFSNDLGADSLDIVELIMAFENELGITIPDAEAEKIQTVGDAIIYIEKHV